MLVANIAAGFAAIGRDIKALMLAAANGVTLNTAQTITADKTFSAPIQSSIGGGAYATWRERPSAVLLSCPDNASAYSIWRAVRWGGRNLASLDVHANGSDSNIATVLMNLSGGGDATFTHSWIGPNYSTNGSITAGGKITSGYINSDMGGNAGSSLEVGSAYGGSGSGTEMAAMAFHVPGNWAVKLGLRGDGVFGLGGWSVPGLRWYVDTKNGNMTAVGSVTGLSDIRLKSNIHRIDNALGKVKQLGGYTYSRLDTKCWQTGLIAQEVLGVLPEAVIEAMDDDRTLSVAYGNMSGLIVEAIKELSMQVDFLSHRVIELEGRKQ